MFMKAHSKDDPGITFLVNLATHMFTVGKEGQVFVSTSTIASGVLILETADDIIERLSVMRLI